MSSQPQPAAHQRAMNWLLPPLLAPLLIVPLLWHGVSCGHDFDFHLVSWMEAAHQLRAGTLHPVWAYTPAYGAGEPRFIFYPPLSWLVGAALTLLLGQSHFALVPVVFTWLSLAASGYTMAYLARRYTTPLASLGIAAAYMANPYMLFTAYERTAYAELLAAAWMPLLFAAIFARKPRATSIAVAVALLWLTNAPAAVAGCYALALIAALRLAFHLKARRSPEARRLVLQTTAGVLLGLALAAFYLTAAIHERPWVQIAMANVTGMRIEDNTLYHHTTDLPHDLVLHTASNISVALLAAAAVLLAWLWFRTKEAIPRGDETLPILTVLAAAIALLLTPLGLPVWNYLPQLSFLQFSWRLLTVLIPACGLLLALAWESLSARMRTSRAALITGSLCAALALAAGAWAWPTFGQACDVEDTPGARLAVYNAQNGPEPTDEYTPGDDDNEALPQAAPAYWLADASADVDSKPPSTAVSQPAPQSLNLTLDHPALLILHLRNYPLWHVIRDGVSAILVPRQDGLIAIRLPTGTSHIALTMRPDSDRRLGEGLSAAALLLLLTLLARDRRRSASQGIRRSRRMRPR